MDDIMKIIKSLEVWLLIKGVSKTIKYEAKGQKSEFLAMLLPRSGASLVGNMSAINS